MLVYSLSGKNVHVNTGIINTDVITSPRIAMKTIVAWQQLIYLYSCTFPTMKPQKHDKCYHSQTERVKLNGVRFWWISFYAQKSLDEFSEEVNGLSLNGMQLRVI
jgi:hypothetical protein